MIITDLFLWIGAFAAGILMSLFYFGFLWWTVQRIPSMKYPVISIVGGYALRMVITLFVFYLIARYGDWLYLLISLAGFILMRIILVRKWGPKGISNHVQLKGATDREYQS